MPVNVADHHLQIPHRSTSPVDRARPSTVPLTGIAPPLKNARPPAVPPRDLSAPLGGQHRRARIAAGTEMAALDHATRKPDEDTRQDLARVLQMLHLVVKANADLDPGHARASGPIRGLPWTRRDMVTVTMGTDSLLDPRSADQQIRTRRCDDCSPVHVSFASDRIAHRVICCCDVVGLQHQRKLLPPNEL